MDVAELVADVRKSDFNFPVLPEAYLRLVSVCDNPFATLQEIETSISNPSILVRVLQIANSAAFGTHEVHSLTGAIHRLGLNFVKNIALCVSMKSMFSCRDPQLHSRISELWSHDALISSICSVMASRLGLNPSVALTCGLLHDIGALVVASYYDQHRIDSSTFDKVVEECSADLGLQCLSGWKFPDEIVDSLQGVKSVYGKLIAASHYADDCQIERLEYVGLSPSDFCSIFNSKERVDLFSALL